MIIETLMPYVSVFQHGEEDGLLVPDADGLQSGTLLLQHSPKP